MFSGPRLHQVGFFGHCSATVKAALRWRDNLPVALTVFAAACSDGVSPATPTERTAALLATSPAMISATVATAVPTAPSVRAVDAKGASVAGTEVRFTVTGGGGSITSYRVMTDESGTAKVAQWVLGTSSGDNVVVATLGSFSLEFHALGVPGDPYALVKLSGDFQIGSEGQPLPFDPRVRVEDKYRNGIAGAVVQFAPSSGGGAVVNGKAETDVGGMAILTGWKLGNEGIQTLIVRAASVTPQVFTATIPKLPFACDAAVPLIAGVVQTAQLGTSACNGADGRFFRMYSFAVSQTSKWAFSSHSSEFITSLQLFSSSGKVIAAGQGDHATDATTIVALLPPGAYTLVVSSALVFDLGTFKIAANMASTTNPCWPVFLTVGAVTSGYVPASQCTANSIASVLYRLHLDAGTSITVTITDFSYSGPILELSNSSAVVLKRAEGTAPYVQTLTFTASASGFYDLTVYDAWGENAQYELAIK